MVSEAVSVYQTRKSLEERIQRATMLGGLADVQGSGTVSDLFKDELGRLEAQEAALIGQVNGLLGKPPGSLTPRDLQTATVALQSVFGTGTLTDNGDGTYDINYKDPTSGMDVSLPIDSNDPESVSQAQSFLEAATASSSNSSRLTAALDKSTKEVALANSRFQYVTDVRESIDKKVDMTYAVQASEQERVLQTTFDNLTTVSEQAADTLNTYQSMVDSEGGALDTYIELARLLSAHINAGSSSASNAVDLTINKEFTTGAPNPYAHPDNPNKPKSASDKAAFDDFEEARATVLKLSDTQTRTAATAAESSSAIQRMMKALESSATEELGAAAATASGETALVIGDMLGYVDSLMFTATEITKAGGRAAAANTQAVRDKTFLQSNYDKLVSGDDSYTTINNGRWQVDRLYDVWSGYQNEHRDGITRTDPKMYPNLALGRNGVPITVVRKVNGVPRLVLLANTQDGVTEFFADSFDASTGRGETVIADSGSQLGFNIGDNVQIVGGQR
jgi:hypothetical protein